MKVLTRILVLAFILTLASGVLAESGKVKMGKKVNNFTLRDAMGVQHSLKDLSQDKKATVLMFIATQCPVSNDYNERMVALHNDYKDKGIQFIGINSNKQESVEEIAEHNKANEFGFFVLKDLKNKIADSFGAKRTPEIYLLDEKQILRYHGAIDNSQDDPEMHYLRTVLDLVVAGKEIPTDLKETKAFGCTIKRVRRKTKATP